MAMTNGEKVRRWMAVELARLGVPTASTPEEAEAAWLEVAEEAARETTGAKEEVEP